MEAICVDVVPRTHDSATLYFFVGDTGEYSAGQFVTIDPKQFPELQRWCHYFAHLKGKPEPVRAYSMSSTPKEKCISITVKSAPYDAQNDDYPPLISPFLVSGAIKGRELRIRGYSGPYCLRPEHGEITERVVHLVAGSGVVPNYAIVKDELQSEDNQHVNHVFIDVNKTHEDIIFRDQLAALAKAFPNRLEVIHLLTREDDPSQYGPNYHKGRPSLDFLNDHIGNPDTALVYACGPGITKHQKKKAKVTGETPTPRFMESITDMMATLNIPKSRFKKEEFG